MRKLLLLCLLALPFAATGCHDDYHPYYTRTYVYDAYGNVIVVDQYGNRVY